ncbi:MAG: alpha-amylase family glycosyl hydrolase [Desulfobacca sp.]|uniref:alpha-amylase family glycosyl hydrolase n=1 Tax=Desulfobacca sp. TaxID=2067990 RepID=UPI00404AA86A
MPCPSPIIYNLFPLLAGAIPDWFSHLPRIARMGFDWLYLNPIHYPGFSGSIYAVKDYFSLHPLLIKGVEDDPFGALSDFCQQARTHGLSVMLDLVLNHTASDALLVAEHPEWFARNPDGSLKHPSCINPADATQVTVWGDLAELEFWPPPDPEGLLHYYLEVIRFYLDKGIRGFRCDAAYKVPGTFWARLIQETRRPDPSVCFVAETLGCRLPEIRQLSHAGFDLLYNSSKWWDFQAPWCLEQYRANRRIAPSISFPETHDTPRLITEVGGNVALVRQAYIFAAFFSAGLLMPMGFEYGLPKELHVIATRPTDWLEKRYDLTEFITKVNHMKRSCPVLQEEGPMHRLSKTGRPVVLLRKSSEHHPGAVLAVINATLLPQDRITLNLRKLLGKPAGPIQEITPDADPRPLPDVLHLALEPVAIHLFASMAADN